MRVLLVDDDVELCRMLVDYLAPEGIDALAVHDGERGVSEALAGGYDAVVMDVMLPRINGMDALREIRRRSDLPVLMLTAKGDDVDRIVGLELGADDYLPKPFNPRELVARLRAVMRRCTGTTTAPGAPLRAGDALLWPAERRAQWRGHTLDLTSTEFNLLETLVRNGGRVVSKAELSQHGLGRRLTRYDRSVDVHVSALRRKLGRLRDGRSPIQTVRGVGYQLITG